MKTKVRGPIDADPFDAIERELVAAASHLRSRHRRRRQGLTIAACALGLLMTAGGALAITNTQTGVRAVDRFLDASSQQANDPGLAPHTPLPRGANGPPARTVAPAEGGAVSPPVDVTLDDGTRASGVGYQANDRVCAALATNQNTGETPEGAGVCLAESMLTEALKTAPARLAGGGGAPGVLAGFARSDVRSVQVIGPGQVRTPAVLSDEWTLDGWQGGPIRTFFASLDPGAPSLAENPRYQLVTELSDGRLVQINP